jgi:hypothetical protein
MALSKVGKNQVDEATNFTVQDGTIKLDGNYPVGTGNVALGDAAMNSSISGNYNTALGDFSMQPMTSGASNTGVGGSALRFVTSGSYNTAVGHQSLHSNTTASENTAVGYVSLYSNNTGASNTAVGSTSLYNNTTGNYNVALGDRSLAFNTTASYNTAVGYQAAYTSTTGDQITAVGSQALRLNTGSGNTAVGESALAANSSAASNTAVGQGAATANTTGAELAALGRGALFSNTTGSYNTAVGRSSLFSNTTGRWNTTLGYRAGYSKTTGDYNTFVGTDSGYAITTGAKNTILGVFNGNQGGVDIRTSNNNIVLSDGDGNPRLVSDSAGRVFISHGTNNAVGTSARFQVSYTKNNEFGIHIRPSDNNTGGGQPMLFQNQAGGSIGSISATATNVAFNTSSDYRLKENVVDLTSAADRVQQLNPVRFNFIADADKTVDGFLAHEVADIVPEAITGEKDAVDDEGNIKPQSIDQSKLVPLLTAALQEALTKIDQLETRIVALEAN